MELENNLNLSEMTKASLHKSEDDKYLQLLIPKSSLAHLVANSNNTDYSPALPKVDETRLVEVWCKLFEKREITGIGSNK